VIENDGRPVGTQTFELQIDLAGRFRVILSAVALQVGLGDSPTEPTNLKFVMPEMHDQESESVTQT